MNQLQFAITDYVTFNEHRRASCPACQSQKGGNYQKLNLSLHESGAYHCFRGCTPDEIRDALGATKNQQIPAALAKPSNARALTIAPQKVKEAHERLLTHSDAMTWLHQRGITDDMIARHQLGLVRAKAGDRHLPAISIPIANADGTAYYQKKRLAPWLPATDHPSGYQPWSQAGIPAQVWFTYLPAEATATWLCEGEWDAILLGWQVRQAELPVAVATFTTGCQTIPPDDQLALLPGTVAVFYDRNDQALKNGDRPGEVGARKVVKRLGARGRIAQVPMPKDCQVKGWDVSNALQHGFTLADFQAAADQATAIDQTKGSNSLRDRLVSTEQLLARAPEFVEWLVPDLLTADELFALGSPPRGGKSLMCMLLARSVASGEKFLDRPVTKGSVIYVNLEDSDAKVRERVEAQEWAQELPVYWLDRFKLTEIDSLIEVADEMDDLRLIILDTLSRVRSDETSESSAEMSMVLEPLQEFAKARKVCILLVHHTRKLNVEGSNLDDLFDSLRGSSAIRGTCRGMLIIAPGQNCYRLAVENGWGKHDLKIRLDSSKLEWQLLGKWNPIVNLDQKDTVLNFLNKVGSATIDAIATETAIPKRSLYTVLDRLCADDAIEKVGSRKACVYQRPIQPIQLLNCLLNSPNEDGVKDRGAIQQKNNSFLLGDQRQSDQATHAKDDHPGESLKTVTKVINAENAHTEGVSRFGNTRTTEPENALPERVSGNDHFDPSTGDILFVELVGTQVLNTDTVGVSAIQQQFNSNSTVELEKLGLDDKVKILVGKSKGKYAFVVELTQDGKVRIQAEGWEKPQTYSCDELRLLKKGGSTNANG